MSQDSKRVVDSSGLDLYLRNPARLAALARTRLPDSPADPSYDRLTGLAATFLRTPVALVSLVDDHRQFFKSCVGLPEPWAARRETPLSHSFCQHVIASREPLVIEDSRLDHRVRDSLAITDLGVIAYLGIPLVVEGHVVGSFCAIDTRPRKWTDDDVSVLRKLAESVMTEIRLNNEIREVSRQRTLADRARQHLQVTLASIGDAVIAADAGGLITFMNRAAESFCRTTSSMAIGLPLRDVYRIFDAQTRRPIEVPDVARGGEIAEFPHEALLIAPDGNMRSIEEIASAIRDARGEVEGVVLVFRDVTEKNNLIRSLRASENQLSMAVQAGRMGTWTLDLLSGELTCTDTCKANYGRKPGDPFTYEMLASSVFEEDRPRWRQTIEEAIAQASDFEIEYRALSPDGSIRWVQVRSSCQVNARREVVSLSGVSFEITERRRADAERDRLVEQLRDADSRKDEFLAMLAHELRNPLGAISSGIQLVQTTEKPELLAQIRDMIQRQVVHLTRLIDDLLDVSRVGQGKIELHRTTIDLAAIVGQAVELVQPVVAKKRHELIVSLPDRPVLFVADPTRTEQILGNLLTNAAKYSEARGSIRLTAGVEGEYVVFRIGDTGVGISAEMLPKVFGLFTQVDSSIDRSQGGLGIGLTLVKNLVEMHGGKVSAASEGMGRGSEFTVRLPIGRPVAMPANPTDSPSRSATGSGRVLVVDDNSDTARLTARMLRHAGFEAEIANDGLEAVDLARRFQPAVVLLDIGLPGLNGYEVASVLREDEVCRSAVLIAVSGYGEEKSRDRSKTAGFNHHLTKPLDFGRLMQIIGA